MNSNNVNIMGNLTRDPEMKSLPSGKVVCNLSIANNRVFLKNGEKVDEVSYFDVDVWGITAENCSKYLTKGNGIIVEGRLRQDRWEKDGKTQSRVKTRASAVHFMPKKQNHSTGAGPEESSNDKAIDDHVNKATSPEDMSWEE